MFNEYLHNQPTRGFPVEYFVEGGRSRTGRMLQPKTGMLALTLRSYLRSSRLPILFVPVYIGYERVLEGRTYLGEQRRGEEERVDLRHFRHRRPSSSALGRSVNFGEPPSSTNFSSRSNPAGASRPMRRTIARSG